jgi:hypothetical protein
MKTDLLEFEQCAARAGDQDNAVQEMVGQFRRKRSMREFVGVDVGFDESRCRFKPASKVRTKQGIVGLLPS